MGDKSRRRLKFLKQHPVCCFCGGSSPSEEEDHFPSKALFDEKQWPVGYSFPACARCNDITCKDEAIVAMLSRMYPTPTTVTAEREFQKYTRAVARNFPGLLEAMQPSLQQLTEARDKYGISPPAGGALKDMPVLSVRDARFHHAVRNFARKLGLALYYKHTKKILPANGGIGIRWYANVQVQADEIPRELAGVLPHFPRLERSVRDLSDQFFYRIGIAGQDRMAAYLAIFRRSFAVVGFMRVEALELAQSEDVVVEPPFAPAL